MNLLKTERQEGIGCRSQCGVLIQSSRTPRREVNDFCTSKEKIIVSGAKNQQVPEAGSRGLNQQTEGDDPGFSVQCKCCCIPQPLRRNEQNQRRHGTQATGNPCGILIRRF